MWLGRAGAGRAMGAQGGLGNSGRSGREGISGKSMNEIWREKKSIQEEVMT